jgi:hypothetical protein
MTLDDHGDEQGVLLKSASENSRYTAVFEDDGKVAYGYMLLDDKIISDVWLYNSGSTPSRRPWLDGPDGMPFANPIDFVRPSDFAAVLTSDEISFVWSYGTDGVPVAVEFWIRGRRHARVTPGSMPGWCVLAVKDGPLARRLDQEQ